MNIFLIPAIDLNFGIHQQNSRVKADSSSELFHRSPSFYLAS